MTKKKQEMISKIVLRLGIARSYLAEELGADVFRKVGTDQRSSEMRCILVSTTLRDRIIKILSEKL